MVNEQHTVNFVGHAAAAATDRFTLGTQPGFAGLAEIASTLWFVDHVPEFLERLITGDGISPFDVLAGATSTYAIERIAYRLGRRAVEPLASDVGASASSVFAEVLPVCDTLHRVLRDLGTAEAFASAIVEDAGRGWWDGACHSLAARFYSEAFTVMLNTASRVLGEDPVGYSAFQRLLSESNRATLNSWRAFSEGYEPAVRRVILHGARMAIVRDHAHSAETSRMEIDFRGACLDHKLSRRSAAIRAAVTRRDPHLTPQDAEGRASRFVDTHSWLVARLAQAEPSLRADAPSPKRGERGFFARLFDPPGPLPATPEDPDHGQRASSTKSRGSQVGWR